MKFPVYNSTGEQIKEIDLSSRIFGVKIKTGVIHQAVVAQLANARQVLAHTKDKSEVRGGGRKPWKQKGTGRARQGSIRAPQWIGGGVTFGPTKDRNFSKGINKKQKQLALAMCLSDRAENKTLVVFDKLQLDNGKTKELNVWLKEMKNKIANLKNSKKFLLVMDGNDKKIISAGLNLKNVNTIMADSLNCKEVLNHDALLVSEKAVSIIDQHYKKITSREDKNSKK